MASTHALAGTTSASTVSATTETRKHSYCHSLGFWFYLFIFLWCTWMQRCQTRLTLYLKSAGVLNDLGVYVAVFLKLSPDGNGALHAVACRSRRPGRGKPCQKATPGTTTAAWGRRLALCLGVCRTTSLALCLGAYCTTLPSLSVCRTAVILLSCASPIHEHAAVAHHLASLHSVMRMHRAPAFILTLALLARHRHTKRS